MGTLNACLAKLPAGALTDAEIAALKEARQSFMKQGQNQIAAELSAVNQALRAATEERKLEREHDAGGDYGLQEAGRANAVEARRPRYSDAAAAVQGQGSLSFDTEQVQQDEPQPGRADRYAVTVESAELYSVDSVPFVRDNVEAAQATQFLSDRAQEVLAAVVTDKDGNLLSIIEHSVGKTNEAQVQISVLSGAILAVPDAASVWLSHNHPSGSATLSSADRNLSDEVQNLLRGSGVSYNGILAVTPTSFGTSQSYSTYDIPAAAQRVKTGVTVRKYTQHGAGATVSSPAVARSVAVNSFPDSDGLLLLGSQHQIVAELPFPAGDLGKLRDTGRLAHVLRAVHKSNALAVIVKTDDSATAQNIINFGSRAGVSVLDVIDSKGKSLADIGGMPRAGRVFESVAQPRGNGMAVADLREAVNNVFNGWFGDTQVTVLDAPESLPDVKLSRTAEGVFLAESGRVYLFADNVENELRARWVVLHEVVGHRGLAALFPDFQAFRLAVLEATKSPAFRKLTNALAEKRGIDTTQGDGLFVAAAEAMAELAAAQITGNYKHLQDQYRVGVGSMRNDLVGRLLRFVADVKAALNKATKGRMFRGMDGAAVEREILDLISRAHDKVKQGTGRQAAPSLEAAPMYSDKTEALPVPEVNEDTELNDGALFVAFAGKAGVDLGRDSVITAVAKMLRNHVKAFQYPLTQEKELNALAAAFDKDIKVSDMTPNNEAARRNQELGEYPRYSVLMPDGKPAYVFQPTKGPEKGTVWINAAALEEGASRGSALYQMVGDYAHANDLVFVADPEGLSKVAQFRRVENVLASAIRHGTTKHLMPNGRTKKYVSIDWRIGDDNHNFQKLIEKSSDGMLAAIPDLKDVGYDLATGQFFSRAVRSDGQDLGRAGSKDGAGGQGRTGRILAEDRQLRSEMGFPVGSGERGPPPDFGRIAESAGARAVSAGRTTLKRAAFFNAVLREVREGTHAWRDRVLGDVVRQLRTGLSPDLERVFYSEAPQELSDEALDFTPDRPFLESVKPLITKRGGTSSTGLGVGFRRFALGFIPVDRLRDSLVKALRPYGERIEAGRRKIEADRNNLAQEFGAVADPWAKLILKDKAAADKMADLMHGATVAGYDPESNAGKPYTPNYTLADYNAEVAAAKAKHSKNGKLSKDGAKLIDIADAKFKAEARRRKAKPGLDAAWATLSDAAKEIYVRARDAYEAQTQAYEDALKKNVSDQMDAVVAKKRIETDKKQRELNDRERKSPGLDLSVEKTELQDEFMKTLQNAANAKRVALAAMDQRFQSNRVEGPYFPLMRFGNFFAWAKDAATGELVSFEKFETKREMEAWVKSMDAAGYVSKGGHENNDRGKRDEAASPSFVADVMGVISRNADTLDAAVLEELEKSVYDLYLNTLPDLSIRKRFMHRKGTEGYSKDAFKAYAHHTNHAAMQTARLRYKAEIDTALMELAEAASDNDVVPVGKVGAQSAVVAEYRDSVEHLFDPGSSPIASAVTGLAFNWHLGISPGAALVNMTQPMIVAMPMLGAKYSNTAAAAEMVRAMRDVSVLSKRRDAQQHIIPNKRISVEEATALNDAADAGVISRTQQMDLTDMANLGSGYSTAAHRYQKVMRLSGKLFHMAEVFNREQVFLAAYRLARKGTKGQPAMSDAEARAYAEEVTRASQFSYENSNRPRLMRSDVAKMLLVFRNYHVNMLYRVVRDFKDATLGSDHRARGEAAKQLGTTLGMFVFVAGVTGTPFVASLLWAVGKLGLDDEDETVKEKFEQGVMSVFGRDVGGMLLRGVLNKSGLDFANRVGLGNVWVRDRYGDEKDEAEEDFKNWAFDSLGAAMAIPTNIVRGASMVGDGDVWRGFEAAAPKFAKDALKAVRFLDDGVKNLDGSDVIKKDDLSVLHALAQAAGMTPTKVANAYEDKSRVTARRDRLEVARNEVLERYRKAVLNGDAEARIAAREAVREWNEEYGSKSPDHRISDKTLKRSVDGKRRAAARVEGGVYYAGKNRDYIDDAAIWREDED